MRENICIFRGKRVDTGQWREGYLLGVQKKVDGKDLFFIVDEMGEYHRVDPETVGEFTGMTDKDGTGIFEGDIVKYQESICSARYGVITFGKYATVPGTDSHNIGSFISWLNDPFIRQDLGFWLEQREIVIIGNIHDNPELLGSDDKWKS